MQRQLFTLLPCREVWFWFEVFGLDGIDSWRPMPELSQQVTGTWKHSCSRKQVVRIFWRVMNRAERNKGFEETSAKKQCWFWRKEKWTSDVKVQRFSQQCKWRFHYPGIRRWVRGQSDPVISRRRTVLIFKGMNVLLPNFTPSRWGHHGSGCPLKQFRSPEVLRFLER
jgi:hypothetical protein